MVDRHVSELWWEDCDTLCIKFEDGSVEKFLGAYIKNIDHGFEPNEVVNTSEVKLIVTDDVEFKGWMKKVLK